MSYPNKSIQFLDERDDVYLYLIDGEVKTIIKDEYTKLKYKSYNGNRIFYDFGDGWKIQETYNDRIFNCYKDDEVINVRDGRSLCQFIEDKNKAGYIEYFKDIYLRQHSTEYLQQIVDSMGDRVTFGRVGNEKGNQIQMWQVDERFAVDDKGTSYYRQSPNGNYAFLCTVANGSHSHGGHVAKMTIETPIGDCELDEVSMTIMAKLNFFMRPNINDGVFFNQLPKYLKDTLIAEYEAKV